MLTSTSLIPGLPVLHGATWFHANKIASTDPSRPIEQAQEPLRVREPIGTPPPFEATSCLLDPGGPTEPALHRTGLPVSQGMLKHQCHRDIGTQPRPKA